MRILIVTPHFYPESFRINDLAEELVKKNHNVTVLTAVPDYPIGKFYEGYGIFKKNKEDYNKIKIFRAPIIPRGSGTKFRLILNYSSFILGGIFTSLFLIKKNFDIIFIFAPSPITVAIPAILIKKIKKIPICLWVQDLWPESVLASTGMKIKFITKIINPIVKYIYKNSDKILVPSNGYISSIKEKKVEFSKIDYLPNWSENIFTIKKNKKINFPQIPDNSFKIMFAGNIGVAQDFESIIKSANLLKDRNIHWIILGDGSKAKWLKEKVVEYKLSNNFHLLGSFPVESMPQYYYNADAMLFSLINEEIFSLTIPSKVQSYLASGKPILAMINGEANKLVKNSRGGFCCPAGDYKKLSENILKISSMSKKELIEMGNNSYNYYQNNFDRKTLINKIENTLLNLILQ